VRINNFEEATKQLQQHLPEYLEAHGIDTSKNFRCINPRHAEATPSMSLIKPAGIRVFCHGCHCTGDIFDACSWLEKKVVSGQGFIEDTLPYLAKKFEIELTTSELTEEEQYRLDTYRAYRYVMEYITQWNGTDKVVDIPEEFKAEVARRGWTLSQGLADAGVGYVSDPKDFRESLKSKGFSATFIDDVDLGRKDIFSPGHFIFTIKDEAGRPVGFAARDLKWVKGEGNPKYVNQKTTGVKNNIYQKGKRLYGLDVAIRSKKDGPLYIMEGYADVLSAQLNGFTRAVATCGTSLTDDHLLLLKESGIYEVVLCFDNDLRGQERVEQLLDNKFAHHKDISISVLAAPGVKDPDDYIRENGVKAFASLKPITAFEWRLHRFSEETEQDVICKQMMPFIASEPSHISQEKMINQLAKFTGFSVKTLQSELNRMLNDKEKVKSRERDLILDKLGKDLDSRPDEIELVLSEAQTKLHGLKVKYDLDNMSEDSTLKFIADMKQNEEEQDGSQLGFHLGPDLEELEKALMGDWHNTMMIFGGKANSGKTSFLSKVSFELANHIENNAVVIYHTIDDSAEQLLPKFICVAEGSTSLEINQVKNPNFWKGRNEDILIRREAGYQKIFDLIRKGHLVIKDMNDGASLAYAESLIKYYQEKYPDRNVVYVLDNFHKLRDFEGYGGEERHRFKTMSTVLKGIATKYHIPVLCTMEYTKLAAGIKPTNDNIAETVQMEYDSNLIAHLWNGSHELGDKASPDMFHTHLTAEGAERKPIIEMNIGKNKVTSFKSKIYFKFFPSSSDFRAQPLEVQNSLMEQVNKNRGEENKNSQPQRMF
jgi:replicative DNA helicase